MAFLCLSCLRSPEVPEAPVACQVQDGAIIHELAILGMGVFCGPDRLSRDAVSARTLVRLPVRVPPLAMDVYFTVSPKRKPHRAAAAFLDILKMHHSLAAAA